jgi:5-methylcytosine-specific restriction endonuclease McrA
MMRFEKGKLRTFTKSCVDCSITFETNSGFAKFCLSCRKKRKTCLECGGQNRTHYHRFCSQKCSGSWVYRNSDKSRAGLESGVKHPNRIKALKAKRKPLIDGLTEAEIRHIEMGREEYKKRRQAVYKRDNYRCVECGFRERGKMQADHIKPWSLFPELRYEVQNGRTLCVECHKKTDTYGPWGIKKYKERMEKESCCS